MPRRVRDLLVVAGMLVGLLMIAFIIQLILLWPMRHGLFPVN